LAKPTRFSKKIQFSRQGITLLYKNKIGAYPHIYLNKIIS